MVAPSWQHDTRYAELLSRFWNYCSYPKHYCSSSPSPQPCEGPGWRYESCLWFSNFEKVRIQMPIFKATQRTITVSHNGIVLTKVVMQIVAQLDDIRSTSIKWILYIINFLEYRMNALVRWSWQRAGLVEGCGAWHYLIKRWFLHLANIRHTTMVHKKSRNWYHLQGLTSDFEHLTRSASLLFSFEVKYFLTLKRMMIWKRTIC